MKNIIIGAVDNYKWNDIKIWALSLKDSGFGGEVIVIVYRADDELIKNCIDLGFTVLQAEYDEFGRLIEHHKFGLPTQAHKLRNFHAWQYLKDLDENEVNNVCITDTRDIFFQKNPDDFLKKRFLNIHMPSENVLFKHEPWNYTMVQKLFGNEVIHELQDSVVCNSGTFFGPIHLMKKFLLSMYMIERDFASTGSDQPTMNVLGYNSPFVSVLPMGDGWAFQCGTTIDPTKNLPQVQDLNTLCVVHEIGRVTTLDNCQYVILHQYERNPQLKKIIEGLYESR